MAFQHPSPVLSIHWWNMTSSLSVLCSLASLSQTLPLQFVFSSLPLYLSENFFLCACVALAVQHLLFSPKQGKPLTLKSYCLIFLHHRLSLLKPPLCVPSEICHFLCEYMKSNWWSTTIHRKTCRTAELLSLSVYRGSRLYLINVDVTLFFVCLKRSDAKIRTGILTCHFSWPWKDDNKCV